MCDSSGIKYVAGDEDIGQIAGWWLGWDSTGGTCVHSRPVPEGNFISPYFTTSVPLNVLFVGANVPEPKAMKALMSF